MKNIVKLLGIIALVAVIGFSMVACGGDDDGGGDTTDGAKYNWVGKWVNVDDQTDYIILNADKTWTFYEGEEIEGGFGPEWKYDPIGTGTGPALALVYLRDGTRLAYYMQIEEIVNSTTVKFSGYNYSTGQRETVTYKKQ